MTESAEGNPGDDSPLERAKSQLRAMFDASVRAVLPSEIIKKSVRVVGNELHISDKAYQLDGNVYLVGFGKAVLGMAAVLEDKLGPNLVRGIVSVPRGSMDNIWKNEDKSSFPKLSGPIDYRESGADNQPDADTLVTTHAIIDMVEKLTKNDILLVLISGGGSALLYMPRPSIQPSAKLELCKKLQNSGADIKELNTVRKKLSMVKGGGLARMAHPARVIGLILSDIVGDPVNLIASGPTIHSQKSPEEVTSILKKYKLLDEIDGDLEALLTSKESHDCKDMLDEAKKFSHVDNFVIGNNALAIDAARREAHRSGLAPIVLRNDVTGDVRCVSDAYARIAGLVCRAWDGSLPMKEFFELTKSDPIISLDASKVEEIYGVLENCTGRGVVLIGAGEPTVVVEGSGKGGRNQELALRFSLDWLARVREDRRLAEFEVTFLSAGTDGQDGPTDAAGAYGYPSVGPTVKVLLETLRNKCNRELLTEGGEEKKNNHDSVYRTMLREAEKIEPLTALKNSDSYGFYSRFRRGRDLLKTGITGTNVMDLHFVHVKKRECGCRIDFERGSKCPNPLEEHDLREVAEEPSERAIAAPKDRETEQIRLNLKIFDSSLVDRCCAKK